MTISERIRTDLEREIAAEIIRILASKPAPDTTLTFGRSFDGWTVPGVRVSGRPVYIAEDLNLYVWDDGPQLVNYRWLFWRGSTYVRGAGYLPYGTEVGQAMLAIVDLQLILRFLKEFK